MNNSSTFVLKYSDKYGNIESHKYFTISIAAEKLAFTFSKRYKVPVEIWHYPTYQNPIKLTTIHPPKY
jgi:hypothetical protein